MVFSGYVEGEGNFLVVVVIVSGGGQAYGKEQVAHMIDKPPTPFIIPI